MLHPGVQVRHRAAHGAQEWRRVVTAIGDGTPERGAMPDLDPWMEHDLRRMMEVTQELGCKATPADIAATRALVGRPLTRHLEFARRAAA
jgi:hypothetical protein